MSMEKGIVGSFHSEQEVLSAIEGLKRQGYRETDMMVVAENRSAIPLVTSRTGVMVEADRQVSTLAGAMMDSFVTMMTAGMTGEQVNSLSSSLLERGLPEFTAKQCEEEINKGKIILLVDTNRNYDTPVYKAQYEAENSRAVRLHEEQLDITKERVQVGELQLHKEIIEEPRTVHVPLIREEVYVERRPIIDGKYESHPFTEDEIIRIPITEEKIEVTKRPVVIEEVIIGKRKIQETKQIQDIIRKEEARIERSEAGTVVTQFTNVEQEELMTESPDILIVEGNPDIATIMAEAEEEEKREKRTGSLAVKGEKNKPEASISKKEKTSGTPTNAPAIKESEGSVSAEAARSNESSSKGDKNNQNQMKKGKNNNSK